MELIIKDINNPAVSKITAMSDRLKLFLDTLGMHPDFHTVWRPSDLGWEPPF